MQRNPRRRPYLDHSLLWKDPLGVVLDEVEIGDLLMHGEWRWDYPTVVQVLSVNEDKTLTVMEREQEVLSARQLEKINATI